jgi:hypothetical protein
MSEVVLHEDFEVLPQLERMRLPKDTLLEILDKAIGEWANVNANDPVETGLYEMRRWMTRFLRENETLKELGWIPCSQGQIEGIRNDQTHQKLVFVNTDRRTGIISKKPSNASKKGPRTKILTEQNGDVAEPDMFGFDKSLNEDPISKYDFWCFCAHVSDESISAEVSRPIEIVNYFVRDYSKRVIIVEPGDYPTRSKAVPIPEDFAEIEQPSVSRKK